MDKLITQSMVSSKLWEKLQKVNISTSDALTNILDNAKQAWKQKTVQTSEYNWVKFDRKDINEIRELYNTLTPSPSPAWE